MILESKRYFLRSGSAKGADSAFEQAIINPLRTEIYVPNRSFPSQMGKGDSKISYIVPKENKSLYFDANNLIISKNLYKRWDKVIDQNIIDLHNRNVFQVLGRDLKTKSKFLICYTPCGSKKYEDTNPNISGGTGTAINIADVYNVEVLNLKNDEDLIRMMDFVKKNDNLINYEYLNSIKLISKKNINNLTINELLMENSQNNIFNIKNGNNDVHRLNY